MLTPFSPIGIFDSGVGGLSVLRAIREKMPEENVLYLGDQVHVPYGPRSMEQIQSFSEGITNFLLNHDAKLIVVACNAASAAALTYLRGRFPAVSFVGMEPAVKPAVETTQTVCWQPLRLFKAHCMLRWLKGLLPVLSCFNIPAPGWWAKLKKGIWSQMPRVRFWKMRFSPCLKKTLTRSCWVARTIRL